MSLSVQCFERNVQCLGLLVIKHTSSLGIFETWLSCNSLGYKMATVHDLNDLCCLRGTQVPLREPVYYPGLGTIFLIPQERWWEPHNSQTSPYFTWTSIMPIFFKLLVNLNTGHVIWSMGDWFDKLVFCISSIAKGKIIRSNSSSLIFHQYLYWWNTRFVNRNSTYLEPIREH